MSVLVTGTAGFIGMHVALRLLEQGLQVIGMDNLNDYYDVNLKKARLQRLHGYERYSHVHADLADRTAMEQLFTQYKSSRVVHLAAQAGVRYASINPHAYISSNVTGFLHILEGARQCNVSHLVFASTSSVYGANTCMPFSEHASTEHPLTLYAASKKANEQMAHSYAHLYGIACTGLRFFTVYGPWGRPDMSPILFAKAITEGKPIQVFNNGQHRRSFTYIDDIVESIVRILDLPARIDNDWSALKPDPASSAVAPFRIYNIGNEKPVELLDFIQLLEKNLGHKAILNMLPLQPGDVPDTEADVTDLVKAVGYRPQVDIEQGVMRFAKWFKEYY